MVHCTHHSVKLGGMKLEARQTGRRGSGPGKGGLGVKKSGQRESVKLGLICVTAERLRLKDE